MRPLRLEHENSAPHKAVAWLIAGGDSAAWLAEIARWGVDDSRCVLHVLPRSAQDPAHGSVLVVTGGQMPRAVPAAAPFGMVAGKIFLPVDAALLPAATDAELAGLIRDDAIVIHPALGAIACARPLAVADLLRLPGELDEPFADISPAKLAHPRIEAIGFRIEESLGDMLGGMRDDIGTEPLDSLDPAADEPSAGPLANGWRKFREAALRAGLRLIQGRGTGRGTGPFGKMREWVERRLRSLGDELERVRNREIHRLLEKFRDNPDDALRHALPLTAPPGRGLAPPSAQLGTRSTDFNLGNLRGGGPADAWNLDQEMRRQLRENYMRLAERERQLGRFSRAAYIYAQLLGDLSSAALVLKEGRRWREAALLYRDHLHSPLEAARCFVQARMLAEAIPIFEKERAWKELGDLHLQLGDTAAAHAVFRKWIAELLANDRPLGAAEVLIIRLDARAEALALLAGQWPDGAQGDACLQELFDLHGGAGEHAAAREAVATQSAKIARHGVTPPAPDWLCHVARNYPDRAVRLFAEDTGRRRIAHALRAADPAEHRRLIARLNGLVPDDRLLPRDVQRFLDTTPAKPALFEFPAQLPGGASLTLYRDHQIPLHGFEWTKAVHCQQAVVLAGFTTGHVAMCRLEFEGATQSTHWTLAFPEGRPRPIVAENGSHLPHLFFAVAGTAPLEVQTCLPLAGGHGFLAAGTPAWAHDVLDAAMGASALWLLRAAPHGWAVSGHGANGQLVGQFDLDATLDPAILAVMPPDWCPTIAECQGNVLIAFTHVLIIFRSGTMLAKDTVEWTSAILAIIPGPDHALPHVAVVLADGVYLCWLNGTEPAVFPAIRDLDVQPVAGFSSDGTLVVIAGAAGYLIEADRRGGRKIARFEWKGATPVALLRGPAARTFSAVERTGRVTLWRFSIQTS